MNLGKMVLGLILATVFFYNSPGYASQEVAHVKVMNDGTIMLDEKPVSLNQLEERFRSLKSSGGAIWYYREDPEVDPPDEAMNVIGLVVKYSLPIKMSRADVQEPAAT